jgi:hypothetical protein
MDSLLTLCILPIIVGVILLLIEYFVIRPIQDARDVSALKSYPQVDQGWSSIILNSIKQFKSYQSNHSFLSSERVRIEEVDINSNGATLIVTVSPRTSLLFLATMIYSRMNLRGWSVPVKSKYRLTIKPGGEIKEIRKLEESTVQDVDQAGGRPVAPPRDEMVLKEIKEPVTRVTPNGVEVTINFVVENGGQHRKIHPRVHYRVAQLVNSRFQERDVYSPDDWIVELKPNTIQPIAFTKEFGFGSVVVLTKPPNKVSVRLIPISTG